MTPEVNPTSPAGDEAARHTPDIAEMRERLAAAEAQCRAWEEQVRATDDLLQEARDKLRTAKRKGQEAVHYRALLHHLRSRWYLRPFIRASSLRPPAGEADDCWIYRGPRFDVAKSNAEKPRRRIMVVGHLLSTMLFGSEKSLLEVVSALDPDRFDVFAVFPERNERVFALLESQVQGIAVLDYSWWRKDRPFREETAARFAALYRQVGIDLVHVNTIMLSDPLVAARRVGIPGITNARELISLDYELTARLGGNPSEIARIVCENASFLLANSAATLADYPSGTRGAYLYNCIDGAGLDLPNAVDPRCLKVGMISSNTRKKGVLEFLELAALAQSALPTMQFYLIGPRTPLIEEWEKSLERRPGNLHLRDYVSPPALAYRDLNLVLNLSRFAESFGRTVAEAMMARRPVIAYHHGALPELIDDGETGFLVPYLDLAAVLERLRFFVEQPGKIAEFGKLARQRGLTRFSCEVFAGRINALYEQLIAEARRSR